MVNLVSTQTTEFSVSDFQYYILLEGSSITSVTDAIDFGDSNDVNFYIYGTVAASGDGTDDSSVTNAENISIVVGQTGTIIAGSDGIELYANETVVLNSGEIIGSGDAGVQFLGDNSVINNNGVIDGAISGVTLDGVNNVLGNTGVITGTHGVRMDGASAQVTNSGSIFGVGDQNLEIAVNNLSLAVGIHLSATGGDAFIQNSGLIAGQDHAILTDGSGEAFTLINSGEVLGDIVGDNAVQTIRNSGQITGDILLDSGDDFYTGLGNGFVAGQVDGGAGEDLMTGGAMGDNFAGDDDDDKLIGYGGNDTLFGNEGEDTLLGGDGQDVIQGGTDADLILGGIGNDEMGGGSGNDEMFGGNDDDEMYGDDGEDRMFGGKGDDYLEGGDANDRMLGDGGDDILIGGAGRDNITGGLGADTFLFENVSDSAFGTSEQDRIFDFTQGEDQIDLSGVFNGDLEFYGSGSFNNAAGVRLIENSSGATVVDVDVDGNNVADMRFFVLGLTGLTADDFFL